MLTRLAASIVLALAFGALPAHAQYTIVDSSGTLVGSVIGQGASVPWATLVATQDNDGLWLVLSVLRDDFSYSASGDTFSDPVVEYVFYTDANCGTVPYLKITKWSNNLLPGPFRRVQGSGRIPETTGYYAGDPVATLTFQSHSRPDRPDLCTAFIETSTAGPIKKLDLTQFVPPFTVQ